MSPWTFHGGKLRDARAAFGGPLESWLDLSTGINPHDWPCATLPIHWAALPDDQALGDLEAAAAAFFGVDPAHACALPGTETGLRLLGAILPAPPAFVASSYRTYAAMGSGPALSVDDLLDRDDASVLLANPNNPDGRLIDRSDLRAWLGRGPSSSHWLIVYEAFADVEPAWSMASEVGEGRQLIIFRSFGKFFGLAGLRLGFVLGPPSLLARFRALLGSWPVSAAAIAIGSAAYRDAGWIAAMRIKLHEDAAALDRVLTKHGLAVKGCCPLFRLVESRDAAALFDRLARRAILTRPFDYAPSWLRIGLPGSSDALARLDRALGDD